VTVHIKLGILERAGHFCSMDGARARKENVKRGK
jgi:hypothetical protein